MDKVIIKKLMLVDANEQNAECILPLGFVVA
jgi:hypothetical protein